MTRKQQRSFLERLGRRRVLGRWMRYATRDVWHVDVAEIGRTRGLLTRMVRVVLITFRGFHNDRCLEKAAALTYMTIFTLPALLAMVFSIAKGFGAYERLKDGPIEAFLERAFPQDGGEGSVRIRELVDQIFAYVQSADLKLLGSLGFIFLLYATIKMLSATEKAFNEIWSVQRARTWVRRFSDYLAIVVITPVVLIVGTLFTATLQTKKLQSMDGSIEVGFGPIVSAVPIVSLCVGMGLILLTLPNTRVRILPAILGGIAAGVLWQWGQFLFVEFQIGLTRANAIFSSFAAVPLFLSWIYLSWGAVFIGAELSFAVQNEAVITSIARTGIIDQDFREQIAPRLAGRIAHAFLTGESPPGAVQLATELGIAPRAVVSVLDTLVDRRLLARTAEEVDEGFLPARDPATITVLDLLHAMRRECRAANHVPTLSRLDERVDRILRGFDDAQRESLHNHTLSELAQTLIERGESESLPGNPQPRAAEHPG